MKPVRHARMRIENLEPAPYNPRKIDDKALAGLRASVRRFGLVQPVVWNERTRRVVGGHQRLKALEAEGAEEADVAVVDLSEEEERALNVALNSPAIVGTFTTDLQELLREIKAWDGEAFGQLRLDALLQELGEPDWKEFDEDAADDVRLVECPECGHRFPA
jgi:hypothetical protein